jgi:phenylacetate-coenzyme A ligase PaaK-like adenylate-forming protein
LSAKETIFQSSRSHLLEEIQKVDPSTFEQVALAVFRYQAVNNPLYKNYLDLLQVDPFSIQQLDRIPCLPIQLFKTHKIQSGVWEEAAIFSSSGTTGAITSQHMARDLPFYTDNACRGFEKIYGMPISEFCVLALLPAYLERKGSSLVFMADQFIQLSKYQESGFFLHDVGRLVEILKICQKQSIPTILLGVSFALWDFAEAGGFDFPALIVMETGGMKGRKEEITRQELHEILKKGFHTPSIHSEYGMTELLSQAYSKGEGRFTPAPTMCVWIREITDPFQATKPERSGAINIIDLANLDTISFIATEDLGKCYANGDFEVLGRLDESDIRGCNLLIQ